MITDAKLKRFIEVNFEGRENLDLELVRDILTVSELYNRNFERRKSAVKNYNASKVKNCELIEKQLNRASEVMRDMAGIRARGGKADHKKPKKGESALALVLLIVGIVLFVLIQVQFKGWEKRTVALETRTEEVINKPELVEYYHHHASQHRHRYYDGFVDNRWAMERDSVDFPGKEH